MEDKTDVNDASVEENLEAAAAASTTETEATGTEEGSTATEKTEENRIPQGRFNEVNEALKAERISGEDARAQLSEAQSSLVKLNELLIAKDEDVQTLNEIKSYVNDPTMAEHVMAIDQRLKGISEEVESGESTPEEALDRTRDLLEATKEEVLDAKADVQAEALITKADFIADKLLDALPDEYNEQDRGVISDLWTEKMDWDRAVADPDNLSTVLTESFQDTLDRYGTPRGALFTKEEAEETTTEATAEPTSAEKLDELMGRDWGATKEVKTKTGAIKNVAVQSDDEFSKAMATAWRLEKANRS